MLGAGETFTGRYFFHVGDVSYLGLSTCCLFFDVGTAIENYYAEWYVQFEFYNPFNRSNPPNYTWDSDWYELDGAETNIPGVNALSQNYPNPFNATTSITFEIPVAGNVRLEVYNIAGQVVESLADGYFNVGMHTVNWDASAFSTGVYFYRLHAADNVIIKRMTLLK